MGFMLLNFCFRLPKTVPARYKKTKRLVFVMAQPEKRREIVFSLLLITGFAVLLLALVSDSFPENQTGAFSLSFAAAPGEGPGEGSGGGSGNEESGGGGSGTGEPFCPRADDPGTIVCVESYNNTIACCDEETEICNCGAGIDRCIGGHCIPKPVCPAEGYSSGQTNACKTTAAQEKPESELQPGEYCCYNPEKETCENGACASKPICVPPKYPSGSALCKSLPAKKKQEKDLKEGEFCCFNPANQKCENGQCVVSCNDTGRQGNQISCRQFSEDNSALLNKWCCPKYQVKKTLFGNEYQFFACGGKKDPPQSCKLMKKLSEKELKKCAPWLKDQGIQCLDVDSNPSGCPKCANGETPDLFIMGGTVIEEQSFRNLAVSQCNSINRSSSTNCTMFVYLENGREMEKLRAKYRGCFRNVTLFSHGSPVNQSGTQVGSLEEPGKLLEGSGNLFMLSCQVANSPRNPTGIPGTVALFCAGAPIGATTTISETDICVQSNLCTTGRFVCYQCTGNAMAVKLSDCDGIDFGIVQNKG